MGSLAVISPEELGRKIDPKNFIALVPVGAGKFVPIRLQFQNSTLAILAGPDKGGEGEADALEIIGKIEEILAVDGVDFRAFKREKADNQRVQRTDTLVIQFRSQEKPG